MQLISNSVYWIGAFQLLTLTIIHIFKAILEKGKANSIENKKHPLLEFEINKICK